MSKVFWKFCNKTEKSAELLLYGDISETSWWGDEVTPKQFTEDLKALGAVEEINVRINSGGGDVFAAQAIGNQLEQHEANVTAMIDGICASAATIVACHCNKVVAANDSTYMVHPVKMGLRGYYEGKELESYVAATATIRENIISLYAKKTGKEKDEVAALMDATTWMTGQQAKENGFVDELTDESEAKVVENRAGVLFVNGINMNLPFDKAPKFVQDSLTAAPAVNSSVNKSTEKTEKEEETGMEIKTVNELEQAYPELTAQIKKTAAEAAANEERARIKDIKDMALPGSEEFTDKAMFTEPMSAKDYAVEAVKNAKAQGAQWLTGAKDDAKSAGKVAQSEGDGAKTDEFINAIRSVNAK